MYRDDQPVFSTRVIVGQDDSRNQSPEFQASIEGHLVQPALEHSGRHRRQRDPAEGQAATRTIWRGTTWSCCPTAGCSSRRAPTRALGQSDVRHEQPVRRLPARYPVEEPVQPRRPPHQSWLHPGGGATEAGRPVDAATGRCHRSNDRDRQHQPGATCRSPCRCSWSTRPRSRMSTASCSSVADVYGRDAEIWQSLDPKRRERRVVAERAAPDQRQR